MAFDLQAMKRAVIKCDENVAIFKAAIAKEIATRMEYEEIVKALEVKAAAMAAAIDNVKIEIVRDGGDDGDLD